VASVEATRCATSDPTPMNHSNKDRKSLAESEEERPLMEQSTML
jgi:hypothetical protein